MGIISKINYLFCRWYQIKKKNSNHNLTANNLILFWVEISCLKKKEKIKT